MAVEQKRRAIDANNLREEIASLRVTVTGLRMGKGLFEKYAKEFRESVLRIIDEQADMELPMRSPGALDRVALELMKYPYEITSYQKGWNEALKRVEERNDRGENVVNGVWVRVMEGTITERVICTNCKSDKGSYGRPPYCNQCGAKMSTRGDGGGGGITV